MEIFYLHKTASKSDIENNKANIAAPEQKSSSCVEQIKSWFAERINAHFKRLSDLGVYDSRRS